MARNPYQTNGPTVIQFSSGRSSAKLAHDFMDAHDGKLPQDTVFAFENTGKEDEESLKFANECDKRWGLNMVWLEYAPNPDAIRNQATRLNLAIISPESLSLPNLPETGPLAKVVTFETASRNGEPFEAVIQQRGGVLPNPRARYCSSEMKTRTLHRFLRQQMGWTEWDTMLGIRADEPKRLAKFRQNPHPETKAETIVLPLAETKISAKDVGKFWEAQSFDLGLPNIGGKTMHGNCDLCFLKPARQVVSLVQEKPERAVWWAKQEQAAEAVAHGAGNRFRNDRPSYAQMMNFVDRQADMFDPNEEAISCFCGD